MTGSVAQRKWVGRPIRRLEDHRFLLATGANYIDDLHFANMAHAAILRSPHAHARIRGLDCSRALAQSDVLTVVTGEEADSLCSPLPNLGPKPELHPWRCLAVDKVRHVGEGVAVVAAETPYGAADGCDLIDADYEILIPVIDPEAALRDSSVLVHESLGSNIAYERSFQFGDVERDFASADVVVEDELRWNRSGAQPIETAGAVAVYDQASNFLTIHCNCISVAHMAFALAAALKHPSNKLDIRPLAVGGSFGAKGWAPKVPVIAGMLARKLGRPVKLVETRTDHMMNGDQHASDRIYRVQLALMRDGSLRSMKIKTIDDFGAYLQFGVTTHSNGLAQVVGPYQIASVGYDLTAVFTNKCQQGACRGLGSEVGTWVLERMLDLAASKLNLDPIELRRKNFIGPEQFPYVTPTGNLYDSGDYAAVLEKALALSDYPKLRDQQQQQHKAGRLIGIGLATGQLRSVNSASEGWALLDDSTSRPTSLPESVAIAVDPTGAVTATLFCNALWGNSPETVVAQLLADEFGLEPQQITITYAGSNGALPSSGPGSSRFTAMVAGAVVGASAAIKKKAILIGAELLEADPHDTEWDADGIRVKGAPDRRVSLKDVAEAAHLYKHLLPAGITSGLESSYVYDHPYTTLPNEDRSNLGVFMPCVGHACHIPVVEVDPETGAVRILEYFAVHDCGTIVNPLTLRGQIIGGIAHGIGTALYEQYVYTQDGQLATSTLLDYLMPTVGEVPNVQVGHHETPSPFTVHGIKGGGEGGRIVAPAAIAAAIDDALKPLHARITAIPMTPEVVLAAIRAAQWKLTTADDSGDEQAGLTTAVPEQVEGLISNG